MVKIKIDPANVVAYVDHKSRQESACSSRQPSELPDWFRAFLLDAEGVVLPVIDLNKPCVPDQNDDAIRSILAAVEDANRDDVVLPEIHIADC